MKAISINNVAVSNSGKGIFARLNDWISDQRRRERTRRELMALGDWELADIGINRGDIDAVVEGRFRRG